MCLGLISTLHYFTCGGSSAWMLWIIITFYILATFHPHYNADGGLQLKVNWIILRVLCWLSGGWWCHLSPCEAGRGGGDCIAINICHTLIITALQLPACLLNINCYSQSVGGGGGEGGDGGVAGSTFIHLPPQIEYNEQTDHYLTIYVWHILLSCWL